MTKLENVISTTPVKATAEKLENPEAKTLRDTFGTLNQHSATVPSAVN